MPGQKTPPLGSPTLRPPVVGPGNPPQPLPGVAPFPPPQPAPVQPANMGAGGHPHQPVLVPPLPAHTGMMSPQSPQGGQQGISTMQIRLPVKKWGAWVAGIAIIALLLAIVLVVYKDSDSSKSASTKLPKIGQGSGATAAKPVEENAPPPQAAASAPVAEEAPVIEPEEEAPTVVAPQCPECPALNEEPEVEPLTLEGLAEDFDKYKKSQRGQWTAIGKLNKQMKEVQADIANIRLDVNEIKKMDRMKVSDLPGMPATSTEKVEAAKPVTVKIKTVNHPGPPPETPRPAKVTRK